MGRLTALVLVVVILSGAFAWLRLGHWLSRADDVRRVDAVVVLSGAPNDRVLAAVRYVADGHSPRVFAAASEHGVVVDETALIGSYVQAQFGPGVYESLGVSHSMRQDADLLANHPQAPGLTSVAVVTSPWQLTRARLTFERRLADRVDVVAWPDERPYEADRWWERHASDTLTEAAAFVASLALESTVTPPGETVSAARLLRALAAGLLVAAAVGWVSRPVARRLGLTAVPRLFHTDRTPVPLLGGLAILAGLVAGVFAGGGAQLGPLGVAGAVGIVVLAMVGLVDDLAGLGPVPRLVWAAAAGGGAWLWGLRANVFGEQGIGPQAGNALVTLLWFVGITHALNLLDHMDGVTAGVGAASAGTIAVVGAVGGQYVVAVIAAALAGGCLGYLVHNRHPARLFMGDMGTLALGFALAALAIALRPDQRQPVSMGVALLALGVPIFDTTMVTVDRIRRRRPAATGATDHTTHRLVQAGWSVRRAAPALWAAQLASGVLAFGIATAPLGLAWILTAVAAVTVVVLLVRFMRLDPWTGADRAPTPVGG